MRNVAYPFSFFLFSTNLYQTIFPNALQLVFATVKAIVHGNFLKIKAVYQIKMAGLRKMKTFFRFIQKIKFFKKLVLLIVLGRVFIFFLSPAYSENTLKIYSTVPEKYGEKLFEAFTQQTGIQIRALRLSAGEVIARMEAEKHNPQMDVLLGGPQEVFDIAAEAHMLEPLPPSFFDFVPKQYQIPHHSWSVWGIMPLVFISNNDVLKHLKLAPPQSWQDFLNPAYKGRLQLPDPRTSGTATEILFSLIQLYGLETAYQYLHTLNKNVQIYTRSGQGGALPIAMGQAAGGIFYLVDAMDIRQQEYPVTLTYPKEGASYGLTGVALIRGSRRKEQALAFIRWTNSEDFALQLEKHKIHYIHLRRLSSDLYPFLKKGRAPLLETKTQWRIQNRQPLINCWISDILKQ